MIKILLIQKSLSGENLHGRGGRCDLCARLPQRGREPHLGGREDLLQGTYDDSIILYDMKCIIIYMYNIFLLGDAGQGLAHSRRQFSSDIPEVWEAFIITFYLLFIIIIMLITIRSGRLCDVVAADMDRWRDR